MVDEQKKLSTYFSIQCPNCYKEARLRFFYTSYSGLELRLSCDFCELVGKTKMKVEHEPIDQEDEGEEL